ncbi:MD-2-related lipid recognition domain-containing protein / ML domain-containing protein [Prunus dulcis]|uniref:MD-2-related lipid recognition domain-containing protein / ML domain-containing protein n=1 Tax=Prunus dulcis TaxID=3755 RepID=A0A4Y1RM23_PRUDU|nr:MD-2-related lipid recognition domain-containing protein / ML domain-containing protein [Prunus dulcis]
MSQTDEYAVKVQGVEILPDPVVRGKPATFNISASTGQAISSGKVGSYNLKMTIKDDHNQKLSCISFNFKIVFGSLVSAS